MSQKYILTLQFFLIRNPLIRVFSSGQMQDKKFAKSHDGNIIGVAEAGSGYSKVPYQIYFFKKKIVYFRAFAGEIHMSYDFSQAFYVFNFTLF